MTVRSRPHRRRWGNPSGSGAAASRLRLPRLYELPPNTLFVRAAPEICFQVIASAGRTVERSPNGDRLVEFDATVDGKRIVTKELVRTTEPHRIDYEWIEGPLPVVEETILFEDTADGDTTLHYEGRFAVAVPWPVRWFVARSVSRRFARAVHEHLVEAKYLAERRASHSRLYPRKGSDEHTRTASPRSMHASN